MKGIFIILATTLFFSCNKGSNRTHDLITEEKMTNVLWDYMKADAYALEFYKKYDITRNDTLKNVELQQAIFKHHQITPTQFFDSYRYYCLHPEKMRVILDSIESKQSREKRTLELNFNKDKI